MRLSKLACILWRWLTTSRATGSEILKRTNRSERRGISRYYLTRPNLVIPFGATAWQKMLRVADDRAFITTMGFDVSTFNYIFESGFLEI